MLRSDIVSAALLIAIISGCEASSSSDVSTHDDGGAEGGARLDGGGPLLDGGVGDGGRADSGVQLTFNAVSFGAKGDGIADDTAAIESAMKAAVAAGGGTVYLPAGQYKTAGAIDFPAPCGFNLVGAGPDATILKGNAAFTATLSIQGTPSKRCSHVEVAELSVDVQNVSNAAAVMHYYVTYLTFRHVRFQNSAFKFIQSAVNNESTIDNDHIDFIDCEFLNHTGGTYETVTVANTREVLFRNCKWDTATLGVLLYQLTEKVRFEGCSFRRVSTSAVTYSLSTNDIGFKSCKFYGPGWGINGANQSDHGRFGAETVQSLRLENCLFDGCYVGYQVGAVNGFSDTGSTIQNSRAMGVAIAYGNAPVHKLSRTMRFANMLFRNNNQERVYNLIHPGLYVAVLQDASLDLEITGSTFVDDQASPSQTHAITFDGQTGTRHLVSDIVENTSTLGHYGGAPAVSFVNGLAAGTNVTFADVR